MTLSATDIKLRQSQRLTDNPDGGGRMVQTEIVDGAMNNLFPDIGDEERTTGRSTLRKLFVHLDTPGTDVLKDAIGVIVDPPADSHVHMSMFATGSYSDVRNDAKNRVEGYITKGVESRYVLLGNHYIGQMALSFYCMKDAPTPDINDNLCLSTTGVGYVANEQYMRVRSILSRTTQTFWDEQGAFERDVIVVETVTALLYNFYGQEADRHTSFKPPTRIYETNVVDANSYYSVKRLALSAAAGDLSVKVDTPYVPIVPATTAETPVVDVLVGLGTLSYVQAGATDSLALNFATAFTAGLPVTRFLGNPLLVGSVRATVGSVTLTDDGSGGLAADSSASPWSGTIDYQAGSVSISNTGNSSSVPVSILATPAGAIADQGFTQKLDVTAGNQGYNYIFQTTPLPAAGTVVVDYRALGKWIRLTDNGAGQLIGKPGQGSGTINYATGSVVVTAGALPDIGSSILVSFGTGTVAERQDGNTAIELPYLNYLLPDGGVKPSTFTATMTVAGADVVASDDGQGNLKIAGTTRGSIVYSTGEISLRPLTLPDAGSAVRNHYQLSSNHNHTVQPVPDSGGLGSFTLPGAPLRGGSLRMYWLVTAQPTDPELGTVSVVLRIEAKDDGAGNILAVSAGGQKLSGTLGTIDYASGAVNVRLGQVTIPKFSIPTYAEPQIGAGYRYVNKSRQVVTTTFSAGTIVTAEYQDTAASVQELDANIDLPPVGLDLTPDIVDSIVPGSVRFTFRGRTYVDRSGSLYYGIDPVSGSGTYAGTIDYASGKATMTQWAAGGANAVSVQSLLTRIFDPGTDGLFFRAPGSPLRPGAFTLRATTLEGELVTATADINGNLTGPLIEGTVDWESGVARVRFGEMVTAAGNEGEPWYDPVNVVGSQVWRPHLMIAGSVYLGTVVYRSIPLSAVVIGLDPVRLPSDGRVPAFKAGQTVLIHHTVAHEIAAPAAGQVVNFGRDRIAQIEVRDAAGTPILSSWYTSDLDNGRLTFSDPLNLSAYVLPVVIRERVDDRRLVVQPNITGEIELNTGLSHDFPAGEAMISTALRLGEANGSLDLQARVENLFDQTTWSNVWSNALSGSAAPGTYNDTDYPIVVTNADAITERWAIRFTAATSFEVIGETVGVIATGNTNTDCAPVNPRTGQPYFRIRREGWGSGWATNNAVRFNTIGGLAPVWMVRTTLPGAAEQTVDSTRLQVIGNTAGAGT